MANFMYGFHLVAELEERQRRFNRACEQLVLLNTKLGEIQSKYEKAKSEKRRSLQFLFRCRILTVEGLMQTYLLYATRKRKEIRELRFILFYEAPPSDDDEMIDE